ncbi:hypothetical protein [Halovenus marina]
MSILSQERTIMPTDDNTTYTKHVWAIIVLWTVGVVVIGMVLALFAL